MNRGFRGLCQTAPPQRTKPEESMTRRVERPPTPTILPLPVPPPQYSSTTSVCTWTLAQSFIVAAVSARRNIFHLQSVGDRNIPAPTSGSDFSDGTDQTLVSESNPHSDSAAASGDTFWNLGSVS